MAQQKRQITNKTIVITAVLESLLILVMVIANTVWAAKQTGEATNKAISGVSAFYLEAMADRRAKTITNLINNNYDEMAKAAAFIDEEKIDSLEELRDTIGKVQALLGLTGFALVDEDNVVYTQYTSYTGRSRHSFLSEETIEDRTISTVSLYGSSVQLCLAIPTPGLSIMGKPMKACFVQLDINDIVDLLAFDDQGRTNFALYTKNGSNLSGTELGPVIACQNFFDALKGVISEDVWEANYENFINETGGNLTLFTDSAEETLCYVPIEGTGWEMAVLIRESVIQDHIRDISEKNLKTSRNQIIFALVTMLIFSAVLLFLVRKLSMTKIEAEKETSRAFRNMATTDSLTGVRNKHAYSEKEAVINRQIRAGELEKLAVVVGDINGLKQVNDTRGHAAGDQLIKDACVLICEYFQHGAVFRVGGDEFVILLQGKGYDTMLEVIRKFNQRIEANIIEKKPVISIGYSVLSQEDQYLQDVFKRADEMMYERKKQLKSMGAPTSRV